MYMYHISKETDVLKSKIFCDSFLLFVLPALYSTKKLSQIINSKLSLRDAYPNIETFKDTQILHEASFRVTENISGRCLA